MALVYLTIEQVVEIHRTTVQLSGGGAMSALDTDKLDSVLHHIQNDEYYPTIVDKLTHLFFCTCQFHCFEDGNKRLAITLSAQFLLLNGYLAVLQRFFSEMENISYHVAAGKIDKDFLREIICAVIEDAMDSEALKLKILNAILEDNNR